MKYNGWPLKTDQIDPHKEGTAAEMITAAKSHIRGQMK